MDKLNIPLNVSLESGKTYFFCTCGYSAAFPFCDGTHKKVETDKRSLPYVCDAAKTVVFVDGIIKDQDDHV